MGHCSDARSGAKTHLANAIRKYGELAFEMTILRQGDFSIKELDSLEKFWITTLCSHESQGGYNQTWGGTEGAGRWHKGKKRSPETRERMRLSKLGDKNPMFGKKNPKGSFQPGNAQDVPKSQKWKLNHGEIMRKIWKERGPEYRLPGAENQAKAMAKFQGKVWIHKEEICKRVKPGEVLGLIQGGWILGMK